jgi:hypothetical protein
LALTVAQKIRVFEVLEVTYGPGGGDNEDVATIHTGFGIDASLTEMDTLRAELLKFLTALDSSVEAEIVTLLAEWDIVRLQTVTMSDGSAGDVSGASLDPNVRREQIRKLMQIYVPVMHLTDSLKRREGPSPQSRVIFGR